MIKSQIAGFIILNLPLTSCVIWDSYLTTLCCRVLICKMHILPDSQDYEDI